MSGIGLLLDTLTSDCCIFHMVLWWLQVCLITCSI